MNISISTETQKLLEETMKAGNFSSADEALHRALEAFDQLRGENIEQLDNETQDALERAFAQSGRGEGRPWAEVRAQLRNRFPES